MSTPDPAHLDHKEHPVTTIPTPEQAAGVRRAAVFLIHNGTRNIDGVNAVLAELAGDQDETVRFLIGLGTVFETLLPIMYSNAGQWLVRQTIADLAGIENGNAA